MNYSEDEWYLESEVKGYAIDKLKKIESEVKNNVPRLDGKCTFRNRRERKIMYQEWMKSMPIIITIGTKRYCNGLEME